MISKQELEEIRQRFKTIEVEFELIEKANRRWRKN